MKELTQKIFILAVSIIAIALITGCEEQAESSVKKYRFIANENRQLKNQLAQCEEELEKQKQLLAQCLDEKKTPEELRELEKRGEDRVRSLLQTVMEENAKQRDKIAKLESEIEQLKKK